MKVKDLKGRVHNLTVGDYLIDWAPKREVSGPQAAVKRFLRPYWDRVGMVVTEETPVKWRAGSRAMRVDLLNWTRKIAIEVSPQSSHSYNSFFHKSRVGFSAAMKRDLDKGEWAVANGFVFVELSGEDIEQLSPQWLLETYDITL